MSNRFSYKFTRVARLDINEVMGYISQNLSNPTAAEKLYIDIEKSIATACEFPFSASDCLKYLIEDKNIREIPVGNYVLIYEIKEETKQINILRFKYAKMNLEKLPIK